MECNVLDQDLDALFVDERKNYVVDFRPDISATLSKESFSRRDVRQIERNLSSLKRYRLRYTLELPEQQAYSFDVRQRTTDFLRILVPSAGGNATNGRRAQSKCEGMRPQHTNVRYQYCDFRGRQEWQSPLPTLQTAALVVKSFTQSPRKRAVATTYKSAVFLTYY